MQMIITFINKQLIYNIILNNMLEFIEIIFGYTNKIFKIQKNALRIMARAGFNAHTNPLFKSLEILKIEDQITLLNCLFVHDYLNGKLPKSFNNTFTKLSDVPIIVGSTNTTINTIKSDLGCLLLPHVSTSTYGLNSLYRNSIVDWNTYVKLFKQHNIIIMTKNELKNNIKKHMNSTY